MTRFASFADIRAACLDLPGGHAEAAAAVARREATLTKPPRSLGRLEEAVAWLALWQGQSPPRLDNVEILVFAGNHGVTAQGVSAYPAEVTAQMVANFAAGGAAINQLAQIAGAELRVIALDLDHPTADFTARPGHGRGARFSKRCRRATRRCRPRPISSCSARWASATPRRPPPSPRPVRRRRRALCRSRHRRRRAGPEAQARRRSTRRSPGIGAILGDPLRVAAALGGRELAAILGAALAARHARIPVLLDGFVCTAAVAPLAKLRADALDHALAGHLSAEAGHRLLLQELGLAPLLDLGMRLGEGSGAAVAVLVLRAALACHTGMATFAEAHVSGKDALSSLRRWRGRTCR